MSEKLIALSSGLGEVIAPGVLIMPVLISPDGTIQPDPGFLHGRSQIEKSVTMVDSVERLENPQLFWIAWVAVEINDANLPVRFLGTSVSELFIDSSNKLGYKNLADQVNRMSEAMSGQIKLASLSLQGQLSEWLQKSTPELWQKSSATFQSAFK